ncbi:hypothetical protein G6F64_013791 [Rhizopus arrhizus]|uniref:Uncharacterized protein n=1 Tax=Rhizopus oryzae TaxID=64495 RepID=A0A9P6WUL1_RHIOR|nr:hypothetical protein G6F64_013791 [Rhizopus arrhizus]
MRAVVEQYLRTLARGQPTQVGQALFGDDHRHVVLGVVDVAGHRHDRRNGAVLGVTRTTDAVHDPRAHHVRRIDVAVDVHFDHAVHADAAEAAHQLRMVGDLLRAHDDALAVEIDVLLERLVGLRAQCEAGARGVAQHAIAQQVEHAGPEHLAAAGSAAGGPSSLRA